MSFIFSKSADVYVDKEELDFRCFKGSFRKPTFSEALTFRRTPRQWSCRNLKN